MMNYLTQQVGGGLTAVEQRPESEVEKETNALDREISAVFEKAQMLRSRLQPVTRQIPIASNKPDPNGKPTEGLSPVADTIRRQRDGVRSIGYELDSIVDQLAI